MANETARLDAVLVARGAVGGREKAKELIAGGLVTVNGQTATKPSMPISPTDVLTWDNSGQRYVGRGGYKLERALELAEIPVAGAVAMDVGASTGGFTDCLLQHGARHVYAVDVGHDQLHPTLRANPAVTVLEGMDVRRTDELRAALDEPPTVCTADVSFISLTVVLPSILQVLPKGAWLVCLIKPQFEAGRAAIGKNGVVKQPSAHKTVLRTVCEQFAAQGCRLHALAPSPIRGGEGNAEYVSVWRYASDDASPPNMPDIDALVKEALGNKGADR